MVESDASDLHLQEGLYPYLRTVNGLNPLEDLDRITGKFIKDLLSGFLSDEELGNLVRNGSVDAAIQVPGMRFRLNAFNHEGGLAASFRRIPSSPPVFNDLNLPSVVKRFANLPRGLVVICGPTGSGKSTTLASLIHHINSTRRSHIITIEEPVEFVHTSAVSLVAQREVGRHVNTFSDALRDALREDPDVILVGEMRDAETIELALRAAETGHLVFSTLHTIGAAGSISRIIDAFDPAVRHTIRVQLSLSLMGVVSQVLIPAKDGKSRVPGCEVLIVTDAVRNLIRENKIEQVPNLIQSGGDSGMISFSNHVSQLVKEGKIDTSGGVDVIGEAWRMSELIFEG